MVQKKQTAVRFSASDLRLLAKIAKAKEWSQSQVMREALKSYAKQEGFIAR